jgi:riboflavin kinase/FMN adenylyltransferase
LVVKNDIKSIAIGSFDGIHLAHQQLINKAQAVVVIERNSGYLTPGYKRSNYINKPIYFYHFDKISNLTPQEFVHKLQNDFPQLNNIIVGYDFVFGKDKAGDINTLKDIFDKTVTIIDEIKLDDISIHSRVIKEYIKQANIKTANKLLGREYQIDGIVIKGQGLGSKEFVPTLNIQTQDYILPHSGVYATKTIIDGCEYPSVSFLGHRVSTDGSFAIETHILDTVVETKSHQLSIKFVDFIRANQKFDSFYELKLAIDNDIAKAREILYER